MKNTNRFTVNCKAVFLCQKGRIKMRAFLGFETEEEFRKIVIHEILPAIAKAYGTLNVCVDAPGKVSNAMAIGIHEHFLKVVEKYAAEQLSYQLCPDCKPDEETVTKMKYQSMKMSESVTNHDSYGPYGYMAKLMGQGDNYGRKIPR